MYNICIYMKYIMYVYTPCDVHALSLIKHIGPGVRSAKYGVEIHSQPVPRIAKWMGKLVAKLMRRQTK